MSTFTRKVSLAAQRRCGLKAIYLQCNLALLRRAHLAYPHCPVPEVAAQRQEWKRHKGGASGARCLHLGSLLALLLAHAQAQHCHQRWSYRYLTPL